MASNRGHISPHCAGLARVRLKVVFIAGFTSIFVLLVLVSSVAIYNMYQTHLYSDEFIEDLLPEMHHTMLLQLLISQAAMPPNDYLIHANPDEQEQYRKVVAHLEQQFEMMLTMPTLLREQKLALHEARQVWGEARRTGDMIMALPAPLDDPLAAPMMEAFDTQIDKAIDSLEVIHAIVQQESIEQHAFLHETNENNLLFILAVSVLGLLCILI
ncbi:MAG: hypothetical protein PVH46_10805, partial [Granulosicoccaceae bacterium]